VAYVLRPSLSHTVNDTIGMFYGGSFSTLQSTASAVWDANYKGVWHLPNGTSLNANDSTSSALNPISTNGTSATTAGRIGGAASLNGSSNYIDYGAVLNITSAVTYSAWFYLSADIAGAAKAVLEKGYDGANTGLSLGFNSGCGLGGTDRLTIVTYNGACVGAFDAATAMTKNTWFYAVATWDGSAWHLYTNGVDRTSAFGTPHAPFTSNARFDIGSEDVFGSPTRLFPGVIDEVRVSSVARTADWILTEYRNQSAPGTYISAGPRVTGTRVRHAVRGGL
jgi:Concanavalin A-like lectin/glucanases superfamily